MVLSDGRLNSKKTKPQFWLLKERIISQNTNQIYMKTQLASVTECGKGETDHAGLLQVIKNEDNMALSSVTIKCCGSGTALGSAYLPRLSISVIPL